uniref:UBX domain-containing protein n=1 Tax=Macrostomum lignano TaxID=282301 RepID=A0A1I8JH24_9PLAT
MSGYQSSTSNYRVRKPQHRVPNGDESSIASDSRRSSCNADGSDDDGSVITGALNELRVQCPNCAHRFPLSEGLLMADPADDETAAAAADTSPAAAGTAANAMMEPTTGFGGPSGSVESLANDFATSGNETLLRVAPESDSATQPVSRCFQILNWTVEQLEKVICDPNDRRIRKISSITQCDIEVRSEMAQSRFGAPKNFCILRANQPVSIEQCQNLLKRQLSWVMKPRAQDSEITR